MLLHWGREENQPSAASSLQKHTELTIIHSPQAPSSSHSSFRYHKLTQSSEGGKIPLCFSLIPLGTAGQGHYPHTLGKLRHKQSRVEFLIAGKALHGGKTPQKWILVLSRVPLKHWAASGSLQPGQSSVCPSLVQRWLLCPAREKWNCCEGFSSVPGDVSEGQGLGTLSLAGASPWNEQS